MQSFQEVIFKILKGGHGRGTLTAYTFITVKYHLLGILMELISEL